MRKKRCSRCDKRQPLTQFSPGRTYQSVKTGKVIRYPMSWCKTCICWKSKVLYRNDPEHYKAYYREYYKKNRAHFHRKYIKNWKKVQAYNKKYYQKNREEIKANRAMKRAIRKSADEFKEGIKWGTA